LHSFEFLGNTIPVEIKKRLLDFQKGDPVDAAEYDTSIKVSPLNAAILNRNLPGGVEGAPGYVGNWLIEYFGTDMEKSAQGVPFIGANRRADQIFFLNQIRAQIKALTYDFQHLEYLLPDEKSTPGAEPGSTATKEFIFGENQSYLIYLGVTRPILAAFEQRDIAKIQTNEKAVQTGQGQTDNGDRTAAYQNPFQNLGNAILVKGLNGEFDRVLTFDLLKDLLNEISLRRKSGVAESEIIKYIQQTLLNENIFVNALGQVELFMASSTDPKSDESAANSKARNLFSLDELPKLFNLRLGSDVQQKLFIQSGGQLSLAHGQVSVSQNGVAAEFNGGTVTLDGPGNNFIFFTSDAEGSTAQVTAPVGDIRAGDPANFTFNVAVGSNRISLPGTPVRINSTELPRALPKKTLRDLVSESRAPAAYHPAEGQDIGPVGPIGGSATLSHILEINQNPAGANQNSPTGNIPGSPKRGPTITLTIPRPLIQQRQTGPTKIGTTYSGPSQSSSESEEQSKVPVPFTQTPQTLSTEVEAAEEEGEEQEEQTPPPKKPLIPTWAKVALAHGAVAAPAAGSLFLNIFGK